MPPAASPPHAVTTRRRCCPTARCWWQEELATAAFSRSAELYDPAIGTWSATGSLTTARDDHTATLLPNGKVLVAGGRDSSFNELVAARNCTTRPSGRGLPQAASSPHAICTRRRCCPTARCWWRGELTAAILSSAELYDPATGTWSATGSLSTARYLHTATLLPNGKVLVAGGYNGTAAFLAARNCTTQPAGRGVPPAASPPHASLHTATLLPNGKVLVAGGFDSGGDS